MNPTSTLSHNIDAINLQEAYLHLLKQTLSFLLWPDPLVPVSSADYANQSSPKRVLFCLLNSLAKLGRFNLSKVSRVTQQEREEGRCWRLYPDTMIGLRRLENIENCVKQIIKDGITGDFIEAGVWRGGACILMRGILLALNEKGRRVFAADSFEGLPKPDEAIYPADKGDKHYLSDFLTVDLDSVKRNFERYGLLDDQVVFLKGWFKDTLPVAPIERLAILRIDGDMYQSTIEALESLYPKLSSGGFCIIDDYHLEGCRKAVEDYRSTHKITQSLESIDWAGRFWRK